MVEKKKQKSDLTLAFIDSSEQVAKLAYESEVGQKIKRMRTVAKSQYRESSHTPYTPDTPPSQFQRLNADTRMPSPKS